MRKFHIYHRNTSGVVHEFDGMFNCSIDAVVSSAITFGFTGCYLKVEAL